jgi:alpha-amylase
MKYSSLKWTAEHFSGTDWDQRTQRNAIYKIIDDPATYPRPNKEQLPMPSKPTLGFNRLAKFAKEAVSHVLHDSSESKVVDRRPGKGWAEDVDKLHGNYDYLIFSNVYYTHPEVRKDVLRWGQWMVQNTGVRGFRLDAAQHIPRNFVREWIATVQNRNLQRHGRDVFVVGEVWSAHPKGLLEWLDAVTPLGAPVLAYAFDTPLLYSFSRVSEDVRKGSKNADLRTLLAGPGQSGKQALAILRPAQAVTFVTNHDSQPGQSSYTPMGSTIKSLFYAFILLRQEGHPSVFWGDLYGTLGGKAKGPACQVPCESSSSGTRSVLPSLMLARKLFAYGMQRDYIDSMSCIGWTRAGTHDRPGCVVVMSIGSAETWTIKKMAAGRPGEKWIDVLSEEEGRPEIILDDEGCGVFACRGMGVCVYVNANEPATSRFPVALDHDVYRQ